MCLKRHLRSFVFLFGFKCKKKRVAYNEQLFFLFQHFINYSSKVPIASISDVLSMGTA